MCIAIYKPADIIINKETLSQCFKANPDGAGFLVSKDKKLILKKGFFTFDAFYKAWEEYSKDQALIHFRIRTHGEVNTENCHPFMVNKSLGFIHNGIISNFGTDSISDTNHFNNAILQPLVNKYGNQVLFEPSIKHLIESRIGYSKLAFLDRHGNFKLFNEDKGVWDNQVWYSNYSYRIPAPVTAISTVYKTQTTAKPKHRTVEIGDIVELITGVYDQETSQYYKKGSILEVVSINKDYTVDLMAEDTKEEGGFSFVYNVSFAKFDFVSIDAPSEYDNAFDNDVPAVLTSYRH